MGISVTGDRLQKNTGFVRSEARRQSVQVTYHGRPELVILSIEDYELLRQNRIAPALPDSCTAANSILIQ
jgi:prevent-host-death family protein